jgi:hypothetical protein
MKLIGTLYQYSVPNLLPPELLSTIRNLEITVASVRFGKEVSYLKEKVHIFF